MLQLIWHKFEEIGHATGLYLGANFPRSLRNAGALMVFEWDSVGIGICTYIKMCDGGGGGQAKIFQALQGKFIIQILAKYGENLFLKM